MENLSLVAAIGKYNELGLDNKLIWKIKEDLDFYRKLTLHQNIIMGRKTFESMPAGALQKRNIFVLSNLKLDEHYDVNCFNDVDSLLKYIEISNREFIVVGGATIYEKMLPYVDTMYLTEIDDYANADAFFPYVDVDEWDIETIYSHEGNYKTDNNINYIRNKYVRRRKK